MAVQKIKVKASARAKAHSRVVTTKRTRSARKRVNKGSRYERAQSVLMKLIG